MTGSTIVATLRSAGLATAVLLYPPAVWTGPPGLRPNVGRVAAPPGSGRGRSNATHTRSVPCGLRSGKNVRQIGSVVTVGDSASGMLWHQSMRPWPITWLAFSPTSEIHRPCGDLLVSTPVSSKPLHCSEGEMSDRGAWSTDSGAPTSWPTSAPGCHCQAVRLRERGTIG